MNYLAHLYLSPENPAIRVGNLMGDFVKGNQINLLPPEIVQGVYLHRAIDKFTDHHPEVLQLKTLLSNKRRRFSGIITDIVFDHLLAKNWLEYHPDALACFAQDCYQELNGYQSVMPEKMAQMVSRMIEYNWLEDYQYDWAIDSALNGISRRIRFDNHLAGAADEVLPALEHYQLAFTKFFPELQQFVEQQIKQQRSTYPNH
ncbi:acyl carrier protein phosphodiesterase [Colwellia sp. MEBiC06753]